MTVSYHVNDNVKVSAGIANITDELEEYAPGEWRGYDDSLYDPLGRTMSFNVQASF